MYSVLQCLCVLLLVWQCIPKVKGQCSINTEIGTADPGKNSINSVDGETGLGLLLNSDDDASSTISFAATCCGIIKRWTFKPINEGTIVFQVWRPTTTAGSYSLIGSNPYAVSGAELNTLVTYNVDPDDRINIRPIDIIGLYTPNKAIIAYKVLGGNVPTVAYTKSTMIGSKSVGDTFDWTTGLTYTDRREYALKYTLDPDTSVAPVFTNVEWTLTVADSTQIATTLFTVTVTENAVVTMTTATTMVTFNSETRTLVSSTPLLPGEYTLDFELSSDCGHRDYRTLTIVVYNSIPVMHLTPITTSVSEDHSSETVLFWATVSDLSLPGDTLSCSLSSTPITDNFLLTSIGGLYTIRIRESPVLDFSEVSEYTLSLSCSDQKDSVTDLFVLHVTENYAPVVTNLPASKELHITEYGSGDVIYIVSASDQDNGPLTYSMTCPTEPCYFSIHHDSGEITVSDPSSLDVSSVNLMISVSDGFHTVGPLQLSLTITGLNDPPVITNLPTDGSITVMENSALSSSVYQITVSDANPEDAHMYTATFDPESGESLFSIDSTNGLISTSSSTILDFEALSVQTFVMSVTVSDGNDVDVEELQIEVTNQNEPPEFQYETYSISGNEGEAGTSFGVPNYGVTDPDSGSTIYFSIDCPPFVIDPNTGSVSLGNAYDADDPEASSSFTCILTVSDGQLSDTSSLHITINNINDNSPTFSAATYEFSTVADVALNTVIGWVTATDGDVGELGTFTYQLDQTLLDTAYFGINEDGGLFVRESLLSFISGSSFTVSAKDPEDATGTAIVSVTILNSPPIITNLPLQSSLTVSENSGLSVSVFQVSIEDVDSDDMHTYIVTFTPDTASNLFNIDNSGLILTSSSDMLDFEALSVHTIVMSVTVSDGNDVDVKELQIEVTNQNEPPEFQYETYSISGNEGEAGTSFGVPNYGVTDPDSGSTFSFSIDCPPFVIDPNTGSVSLGNAYDADNPEAPSSFTCILTVSDGQLSDTSSLHITIININDNSPSFSAVTYEFSTVVDVALNTVIGWVTATDGDVGELGTFIYQLDQTLLDTAYFGINEDGGVFVRESLLSFISGSSFTVSAKDPEDATGTAIVSVTILNSPPIITNLPLQSSLTVSENSGLSVSVFQLSVEDVDSDDMHTYIVTFTPETASNLFNIDNSGLILTSSSDMLDFEALSVHTIVMSVTVSDGNDIDVKELQIEVTNQNEPPEFQYETYSISGNEGEAGTSFGVPNYGVTDPDSGSTFSFSIDCPPFVIDPSTGSVSLSTAYDADDPEALSSFTCILTVSDGQLSDTSSLHITINNINDNSPTFSAAIYEFSTVADLTLNTVIGSVTASDGDVGDFGTFTYHLDQTPLDSEYFGIDENGGVFVRESLLPFTSGSSLTVTAKDAGDATGTASIVVTIQNSSPVITNLPLQSSLSVSENVGLSVSIFQVSVEDVNFADTHTYSATSTPAIATSLFGIDSNNGLISTSSSAMIDYESLSVHTIVMSVTVSDGNALDIKELHIEVTNQNEPPEFQRDTYAISGNEGVAGTAIGSPEYGVVDPDGDSGLSFSMDCPPFSIDSTTGSVSLSMTHDVDNPGATISFACAVMVSDGQLTDTASLLITLDNINDNSPTFSTSTYEFSAFADVALETVIGSVTAVDGDVGDFGTFTYQLDQTQLGSEYFEIDGDGRILVKYSLLTFPSGSSFMITAKDTGNLFGSATITVMILNSAPVISNLPLATALQVWENSGFSVSIFQVLAEDVNFGDIHNYSATFSPNIASEWLDIDTKSGVIRTSALNRIDFESLPVKTFVMTVTVSDGQGEDTEHIIIEIIDVNEAPQFGRDIYHVYGNEGKMGETFGRVIFDVSDSDTMSTLTLQVTSCPGFEIDTETNEITLREDYDVDVQGTPLSVTCEVTVSDGRLTDTASLVLHVNNINDNSPVFINSSYSFNVKVNSSIGTFVGSVSAVDNDIGEYGLLKYKLTGQDEIVKYFAISDYGELTTKDLLPIRFSAKLLELSAVTNDVEGRSDKASILVMVKPSSSDLPGDPDRYLTFLEDSRNIAWLVPVSAALALCLVLVGYIIIRHVILPRTVPKSNKIDKWIEPRKKSSKPTLAPSTSSKSLWEPWRVNDF